MSTSAARSGLLLKGDIDQSIPIYITVQGQKTRSYFAYHHNISLRLDLCC